MSRTITISEQKDKPGRWDVVFAGKPISRVDMKRIHRAMLVEHVKALRAYSVQRKVLSKEIPVQVESQVETKTPEVIIPPTLTQPKEITNAKSAA